jgi:hypothetical protein
MRKNDAIHILGGSTQKAADALGVTYQAVKVWPETLPLRIADRCIGAYVRKNNSLPELSHLFVETEITKENE